MNIDDMKNEILHFCEIYAGKAIGEETRHRVENLSANDYGGLRNIYLDLEEHGWL